MSSVKLLYFFGYHLMEELLFNTALQQLKTNFSYAAAQQQQKHETLDLWVVSFWVLATEFGWTNIIFFPTDMDWA